MDAAMIRWCQCGGRLRKGKADGKYTYFVCIVCGVDYWLEAE